MLSVKTTFSSTSRRICMYLKQCIEAEANADYVFKFSISQGYKNIIIIKRERKNWTKRKDTFLKKFTERQRKNKEINHEIRKVQQRFSDQRNKLHVDSNGYRKIAYGFYKTDYMPSKFSRSVNMSPEIFSFKIQYLHKKCTMPCLF